MNPAPSSAAVPAASPAVSPGAGRLASLDAYRGFVMLLMMAEVLELAKVARAFPDSPLWQFLAWHQSHVAWEGCSLHDLIQPSFSFLVGVALPFSLAARRARGQSDGQLAAHALWRAVVLVALGIFLRSVGKPMTNFTFEDTLTQIGLGYPVLFLLGLRPRRAAWVALAAILVGVWGAWTAWGGADPWAKNANLGHAFDVWFLNLFPRPERFVENRGGYLTLSFIPTLATMILGLLAGRWLQDRALPRRFVAAGIVCLALGWAAAALGLCPIVKRIWTPSWVLYSGGWCFLLLAAFHTAIDVKGWRAWAWPLEVVGMNSIAAYLIAHLWEKFIFGALETHLGKDVWSLAGPGLAPLLHGAAVLAVMWGMLVWMHRRGILIRV
ncbi:MAG: acyltransferase family protein [Planctomycetota bacterium]